MARRQEDNASAAAMHALATTGLCTAIATVFAIIRESAFAKTDAKKAHEAWISLKECVRVLPRLSQQQAPLVCGSRRATADKRREMRRAQPRAGLPATLASLVCSAMRRFGAPVRLAGVEALQNMTAYTDIAHRDVGAYIIPEAHSALLAVLRAEHPHEHERVPVAQSVLATLWNVALLDDRVRECTCVSHADGDVCGRGACVRAIVDAGVLPHVVAALRAFPTAAKLLHYGCGVLSAAVACPDPCRRAVVIGADSVRVVVEVIQRCNECAPDTDVQMTRLGFWHDLLMPDVLMTCLGFLHDLLAPFASFSVEMRGAAIVRDAGGVAVLHRLLCSTHLTVRARTLVTVALWNACLDDVDSRAMVVNVETVCAITRTLDECRDASNVVASCVGLLYTICIQSDDLRAAIRGPHVMRALLDAALEQRTNYEVRRNLCTLVAVLFQDCDADVELSHFTAALWHYACDTFANRKRKDLVPVFKEDVAPHFMLLATACAAMRALGKSGMALLTRDSENAPSLLRTVAHVLEALEECGEHEDFVRLQCEATVDALLGRRSTRVIAEADVALRERVLAG